MQAYTIAKQNARTPIHTHFTTSPFAIYTDNKYIPHSIDRNIRDSSHSSITKDCLATKYNWTMQLMERINWKDHSTNMHKLYPSKKLLTRRFIHHRLPKGKMYFHNQSRFSYCNIMFTNRTHHHHFLTCIWTGLQKHKRLQSLSSTLIKQNTHIHTHPFEHKF